MKSYYNILLVNGTYHDFNITFNPLVPSIQWTPGTKGLTHKARSYLTKDLFAIFKSEFYAYTNCIWDKVFKNGPSKIF